MFTEELDFYATPGPMTALHGEPRLLAGVPADAAGLCRISKRLIVHEFVAGKYGVGDAAERAEELETRSAGDMAALIDRLDPRHRPLAEPREPEHRMIGNCRHFSVLTCALLRRAGIPARVRAGFADYLDDSWSDHWIVERWDAAGERWMRTDAQLDEMFQEMLGFEFDPLDLPEGRFLTGSEAWRRVRRGDDDPARFGIMDLRGTWFIAGSVVRDLAALQKIELLPWDVWGLMDPTIGAAEDERTALLDEVAAAVVGGSAEERQGLFERDGLRVPPVVHSHRFQRDVRISQDVP